MSKRGLSSTSSSSPASNSESPQPEPKPHRSGKKKIKFGQNNLDSHEMDVFLKKLESLEQGQKEIKTEIKQLSSAEAKVVEIEDRVVQLERLAREKNVIMHGLEDSDDENWQKTTAIVSEFLKNSFGIGHNIVDIAERLEKFRRDRVRPIRIKFIRLYDKKMIMIEKKKLDKPIYINADMSLQDRKANSTLQKKKKELIAENPDLRYKVMRGKIICSDKAGVKVKEYCVSNNLEAVVEARECVGLDMDI